MLAGDEPSWKAGKTHIMMMYNDDDDAIALCDALNVLGQIRRWLTATYIGRN